VHAANVRHKLNLKTTAQLIRFAVQWEDVRSLVRD
jgi:DNA-binding CsgD family transcriptional regulator